MKSTAILLFSCVCLLSGACKEKAAPQYKGVLPHEKLQEGSLLDSADMQKLAEAKGAQVKLVTREGLKSLTADNEKLTLIHFMKGSCKPCVEEQLKLQSAIAGAQNVSLFIVFTEGQHTEQTLTNLVRTTGLTGASFLCPECGSMLPAGIETGVLLRSADGYEQWVTSPIDEGEWTALLQPFLL